MEDSLTKDKMILERIVVGPFEVNCYIFGDAKTKEVVVIDPGENFPLIWDGIQEGKYHVKGIVLTHGHADHIGAVGELKNKTQAPIYIHPEDKEMLTDPKLNRSIYFGVAITAPAADKFLKEGDILKIGNVSLKVIHTPGHTPGGICLEYDKILFTGDTLFASSIGRTDFPGSSFQSLIDSIKKKLLILPDEIEVFPGHGPSSTIGEERVSNPFLQEELV
ncbi:MAG TPA: MBL fold metallo-hydrolase [candidate division Zixibacteria bacterium]|nr:MBL fold metallo-hydrolase [candidate division Zixibacteria bacterium]